MRCTGARARQQGRVGVHLSRVAGSRGRIRAHPMVDEEQGRALRAAVGPAGRGQVGLGGQQRRAREAVRRLLREALVGRLVPGRGAGPVLGQHHEPVVGLDHLAQSRPVTVVRRREDVAREVGVADGLHVVGRRDVVLVDDDDHVGGMGDEEVVHVVEAARQRRRAELAQRVAEVHAALALAMEAQPLADAQRGGEALVAHAVLVLDEVEVLAAVDERAHPAAGEPVGVVGVPEQAADPVLELAGDRAILLGGEPALERRRHRVVRGREDHLVEGLVAQARVAVACGDRGRGRARAAPAQEGDDRAGDEQHGDRRHREAPGAATEPAGSPLPRRRLLLGIGRPVDQPQDRLDALVGDVDADERRGDLDRRQRLGDDERPDRDQRHGAHDPCPRRGRLGGGDPPRAQQRPLDRHRANQRRRGGGHHGARARQDPSEGAQVGEEGSPHRGGGRTIVGIVELAERDRSGDRVRDDDQHPDGDQRHPELRRRPAAVARDHERRDGRRERQRRQDDRRRCGHRSRCARRCPAPSRCRDGRPRSGRCPRARARAAAAARSTPQRRPCRRRRPSA